MRGQFSTYLCKNGSKSAETRAFKINLFVPFASIAFSCWMDEEDVSASDSGAAAAVTLTTRTTTTLESKDAPIRDGQPKLKALLSFFGLSQPGFTRDSSKKKSNKHKANFGANAQK